MRLGPQKGASSVHSKHTTRAPRAQDAQLNKPVALAEAQACENSAWQEHSAAQAVLKPLGGQPPRAHGAQAALDQFLPQGTPPELIDAIENRIRVTLGRHGISGFAMPREAALARCAQADRYPQQCGNRGRSSHS
jgi:hypothetical protein